MRAAKHDKGIKYFQLYAAVVIKTANVVIQRCRFAGDGTKLLCAVRAARVLVFIRPIKFLICGISVSVRLWILKFAIRSRRKN